MKHFHASILVAVASIWATALPVYGEKITGLPLYSVYDYQQLNTELSSSRLIEDSIHRILAIEEGTLLAFDGRDWTPAIERNENTPDWVIAVSKSPDGTLYAGTIGNWGYLLPHKDGRYMFRSIGDDLDRRWASTSRFDTIVSSESGALFAAQNGVVVHEKDGGTHVYREIQQTTHAFWHKDSYYIARRNAGMIRIKPGQEPENCEWTTPTQPDRAFIGHMSSGKGVVLLSQNHGFFLLTESGPEAFSCPADPLIRKGSRQMVTLSDGYVAIAIDSMGLLFLNADREVVSSIPASADHRFAVIEDMIHTDEGILWVSLNEGLAKVFFPSPLSVIDHRLGPPLGWPTPYFRDDAVYIHSFGQVLRPTITPDSLMPRMTPVTIGDGIQTRGFGIDQDGDFLIGSPDSILQYNPDTGALHTICEGFASDAIHIFRKHPDFAVSAGTIFNQFLRKESGVWKRIGLHEPSMGIPGILFESSRGDLWIEHGLGRVCRISIENETMKATSFDPVPHIKPRWINVWEFEGSVYLKNLTQVIRFDPETESFSGLLDLPLFPDPYASRYVSRPGQHPDGSIWMPRRSGVFLLRPNGPGQWTPDYDTLRLLRESHPIPGFAPDGTTYLRSQRRLICHDPSISSPREIRSLAPLITKVSFRDNNSHGFNWDGTFRYSGLTLRHSQNSIAVSVMYPSHYVNHPPAFQHRLIGLSDRWSDASQNTTISFTNLWEGPYRFEVRSIDANGIPGPVAGFEFLVRPPFYRTSIAWVFYVCLSALAIWWLVRHFSQKHQRDKLRLSQLVETRTQALNEANAELKQALDAAQAASVAKSQFLANMSHEIRTPMNGVVGMMEVLSRSPMPDEQREIVSIATRSSGFLISILNDILDYSKIEAGKIEIERVPSDLASIAEEVLETLGGLAADKRIDCFISSAPEIIRECVCDPVRLRQVLLNLVSNAIKFTNKGEVEIHIETAYNPEKKRCEATFRIRDTGIGIPPEKMERLFTPFTQLDASDTRIYGGTGLGLTISRKLVELMHGAISVSSTTGEGSEFTVSLPLECPQPPAPATHISTPGPLSGRRILLVDSCAKRRDDLRDRLLHNGAQTECHASLHPDHGPCQPSDFVILLDPESTDSTIEWIRTWPSATSTILIHGRDFSIHDDAGITHHGIGIPVKPFTLIQRMVRLSKGETSLFAKPAPQDFASGTATYRTLIVEDNTTNRKVAEIMMQKLGMPCESVSDGRFALERMETVDFKLILMDVQMPVMDGIEATRIIRSRFPPEKQPKIIALTAGAMQGDRDKAIHAGMDGFISKPMNLDSLKREIERVMGPSASISR